MKGSERNKPCSCGSGIKAKKCTCRLPPERALSEPKQESTEPKRRIGHSSFRAALLAALSGEHFSY